MNNFNRVIHNGKRFTFSKPCALNPRLCRAFTLVELLVVIAIISLLAGLLIPSLENALESAKTVECSNRLRQLMTCAQQYEGMFDVILPPYVGYYQWGTRQDAPTLLWDAGLLDPNLVVLAENWGGGAYPANTSIDREPSLRAQSIYMCPSGVYGGRAGYFYRNGNYNNGVWNDPAHSTPWWKNVRDGVCQWNDGLGSPMQGPYPSWNPAPDRSSTILWCTPISYTMNANLCKNIGGTGLNAIFQPIRSYKGAPSKKLFYIESAYMHGVDMAPVGPSEWYWRNTQTWAQYSYFRAPHMTNNVYSCHDGHVSIIKGIGDGAFEVDYDVISPTKTGADFDF